MSLLAAVENFLKLRVSQNQRSLCSGHCNFLLSSLRGKCPPQCTEVLAVKTRVPSAESPVATYFHFPVAFSSSHFSVIKGLGKTQRSHFNFLYTPSLLFSFCGMYNWLLSLCNKPRCVVSSNKVC